MTGHAATVSSRAASSQACSGGTTRRSMSGNAVSSVREVGGSLMTGRCTTRDEAGDRAPSQRETRSRMVDAKASSPCNLRSSLMRRRYVAQHTAIAPHMLQQTRCMPNTAGEAP